MSGKTLSSFSSPVLSAFHSLMSSFKLLCLFRFRSRSPLFSNSSSISAFHFKIKLACVFPTSNSLEISRQPFPFSVQFNNSTFSFKLNFKTFRLLAIFHTESTLKTQYVLHYLITLYTYQHLITMQCHSPGHKLYLGYSHTDQVANCPINTVRYIQVD